MRILLLTQIVPYPPDSGPKIKTYNVIRYLYECGHKVTLVAFVRDPEFQHLDALRPLCQEIRPVKMSRSRWHDVQAVAAAVRSGRPVLVERDAKREMYDAVASLVKQSSFDIIHADQLTMAQFALAAVNEFADHRPAVVLDAHNAVWQLVDRAAQTAPFFAKPMMAIEAKRLKRYEGHVVNKVDHTLVVSDADKLKLAEAAGPSACNSKISTIPIAIDCKAMLPLTRTGAGQNIVAIGTLYYPPNADGIRWFLKDVMPKILEKAADCTLTLIGPRPPADFVQYSKLHPEYMTLTGYIPKLEPYLTQAALTVVPVRAGSGMRVRILEALALGIPVVTTSNGVEGIAALHGQHLMVADDPEAFADAVVSLLRDSAMAGRLANSGRNLAEQKYDWRVVLPTLSDAYAQAITHAHSTP